MQTHFHVKKGDMVAVISGKDKGKTGEISRVVRKDSRVVVKGVNMRTHHKKATAGSQAGIVREEGAIHISNVMHLDPKDNKPTRIGYKIEKDGKKVRFAKRSGEVIDR
jgi:large subunit ribosomal protein L24